MIFHKLRSSAHPDVPGLSGDALLPGGLFVCPKGPILPKRLRSPGALRIMIDVLLCPKNV